MKARTYIMGRPEPVETDPTHSAILEVELDDGRTVQLTVEPSGRIFLRGWGNIPAKIGNGNSVTFACQLNREKQTTCPICYNPFGPKDRCCGKLREYT